MMTSLRGWSATGDILLKGDSRATFLTNVDPLLASNSDTWLIKVIVFRKFGLVLFEFASDVLILMTWLLRC